MSDPNPITRLNAALEGRYRIERELGEGGMATVYLADDLKHERKVALKVLKPELAAVVGAERFLAEIKTTANLQHPHILPLFDSGEADSFLFYVMPYVEGESLRERLDREKQLPVDEAVRIATEVAEALDHAHRQGVIHRDIKPANLLLRDGRPLIADFGIALAVGTAGSRLTETGLSLGTPFYMSPEQATGDQRVGPATDTYALGCVLYEMLVGDPPFMGSTAQAVLGQIITGEPVSAVEKRRSIPPNVDAAVRKALEKLPADRFVHAAELAAALTSQDFRHGLRDLETEGGAARSPVREWMLALGAAGVGLAAGLVIPSGEPTTVMPSASPMRFEIPVPDGLMMPFAQEAPLALSPDGSLLAYNTAQGISIRPIASFEATVLPNTQGAMTLMFSPDGSRIAFFQESDLRWVPVEGGGAVTVAEMGWPGGVGSTWSANGGFLLTGAGTNGIVWVPEDGGDRTQITAVSIDEGENIHAWPTDLPGTDAILYTALGPGGGWEDGRTVLFDPTTGTRDVLVENGTNAQYSPTGHILYVDDSGTVFARPFDLASREWTGSAEPVVSGVRTGVWGGGAGYYASDTGVLAWIEGSEFENHRLVTLDRSGSEVEDLGLLSNTWLNLSQAGDRLAVNIPTGNNIDMWVLDIAAREWDKFTIDPNEEESAVWSPDDARVLWAAAQPGGGRRAYVQPVDRSTEREFVFEHPYHLHVTDWSDDGRYIAFYDFHPTEGRNVYLVDLEDSARIIPVAVTDANESDATFSPDGRWLAYASDETGEWEVFVTPLPEGQKRQVSTGGGSQPRWDRRQQELYYLDKGWFSRESPMLIAREIRSGDALGFGPEVPLFSLPGIATYAPSPDGQRFHTFLPRLEAPAYSIRVLLNWTAELGGSQ